MKRLFIWYIWLVAWRRW